MLRQMHFFFISAGGMHVSVHVIIMGVNEVLVEWLQCAGWCWSIVDVDCEVKVCCVVNTLVRREPESSPIPPAKSPLIVRHSHSSVCYEKYFVLQHLYDFVYKQNVFPDSSPSLSSGLSSANGIFVHHD